MKIYFNKIKDNKFFNLIYLKIINIFEIFIIIKLKIWRKIILIRILKWKFYFLLLTFVLLIILSQLYGFKIKRIFEAPQVGANFLSQQFCSCFYVIGQTEKFCESYVKYKLPFSLFHNLIFKEVRTKVLFSKSLSKYVNDNVGCVIINSD